MPARAPVRAPSAQKPAAEARTGARERPRALSRRPAAGQGAVEAALSAPGAPLPERERREMEARFRRDFAAIRIHADPRAAEAARELGAQGFAIGRHIVVDSSLGPLDTPQGRALLAHELAHVAQQGAAPAPEAAALAPSRSVHETEATISANAEGAPVLTPAPAQIALSTGSAAKPSSGGVTGAQVFLNPPMIVFFSSTAGPVAASLRQANFPPGRHSLAIEAHKAAPKNAAAGGMQWRVVNMTIVSDEQMPNASSPFSVSFGKIDPLDYFGTQRIVVPLVVSERAGEMPPADPHAPPASLPDAKADTHDASPGPADEPKVEDESNPDKKEPARQIVQTTEHGLGTAPEIDPSKLRVVDAWPATLEGPDYGSSGGRSVFMMKLNYASADTRVGRVFEAANHVNYLWELYEPGRAREQSGRLESALDHFRESNRTISEDTEQAQKEQAEAAAELDAKKFAVALAAEQLEPASRLVRFVGDVFNLVADAIDGQNSTREVVWPKREGIFVLRVVAQPVDIPQEDGTMLRRRPSVRTQTVTLKTAEQAAKDARDNEAKALEYARYMMENAKDPLERKRWNRFATDTKAFYNSATALDYLQTRKFELEQDLQEARDAHDEDAVAKLKNELEALAKQIELASTREGRYQRHVYRPLGYIVSEVTGDTYRLLLDLAIRPPQQPGGSYTVEISDLTSHGGRAYTGVDPNVNRAAQMAALALSLQNDYGRGQLVLQLPSEEPFGGQVFKLPNRKGGDALARERLGDVLTIAGAVGSLAGPEVGLAVAAANGLMAADKLVDRFQQDHFHWDDPETINDIATIFVSAATLGSSGLQQIGQLQVARGGSTITLRVANVLGHAGGAVGEAQMFVASADTVTRLVEIQTEEREGRLNPKQAREQRAQALNAATQMAIGMATSHMGGEKAPDERASPAMETPATKRLKRAAAREGAPPDAGQAPRGRAAARGEPVVPEAPAGKPANEPGAPAGGGGEPRIIAREAPTKAVGERPAEASAPPADEAGGLQGQGRKGAPPGERAVEAAAPPADEASALQGEGRKGAARVEPPAEVSAAPAEKPGASRGKKRSGARRGEEPAVRSPVDISTEEGPPSSVDGLPEVTDLPKHSVISNIKPGDAKAVYESAIRELPQHEAGIFEDAETGERVVVQGGFGKDAHGRVFQEVGLKLLRSDPEFKGRKWKLVEHYHPGKEVTARLPSHNDFKYVAKTHRYAEGKVSSMVRWVDHAGQPHETVFEHDPHDPKGKPYKIHYDTTDGQRVTREFVDPPWVKGSDFQVFTERFTGASTDVEPPSLADRDVPTPREVPRPANERSLGKPAGKADAEPRAPGEPPPPAPERESSRPAGEAPEDVQNTGPLSEFRPGVGEPPPYEEGGIRQPMEKGAQLPPRETPEPAAGDAEDKPAPAPEKAAAVKSRKARPKEFEKRLTRIEETPKLDKPTRDVVSKALAKIRKLAKSDRKKAERLARALENRLTEKKAAGESMALDPETLSTLLGEERAPDEGFDEASNVVDAEDLRHYSEADKPKPDDVKLLQSVVDEVSARLLHDPEEALSWLSEGEKREVSRASKKILKEESGRNKKQPAPTKKSKKSRRRKPSADFDPAYPEMTKNFGKAVERAVVAELESRPELARFLPIRQRPYVPTPDIGMPLKGKGSDNADITTNHPKAIADHKARRYGNYTDLVTYPSLPKGWRFPPPESPRQTIPFPDH
jgi:hypothetical protein